MRIAFTGTQKGMTAWQKQQVRNLLFACLSNTADPLEQLHHGLCVGSDVQCHDILRELDPRRMCKIHGHPCDIEGKQVKKYYEDVDVLHPVKPPLERNVDMVMATEFLIATPAEWIEKIRSGTWYTIRQKRRQTGGGNLFIFYPAERYSPV